MAFLVGAAASRYRFQDAVAQLVERGATRVVVVPLLVSSHSGHYEQIRWLSGETDEPGKAASAAKSCPTISPVWTFRTTVRDCFRTMRCGRGWSGG